jgi:hypothetical protein
MTPPPPFSPSGRQTEGVVVRKSASSGASIHWGIHTGVELRAGRLRTSLSALGIA